jgi:putative (di)nucleoside polyphosphate hydrolase
MNRYRPNVAAILQRGDGQILIGERVELPGAWQFPQGGIHDGEDPLEALRRELQEEIGVSSRCFEVVASRSGYRYLFPEGVRKKRGWTGQEQTYFLCRYSGEGRSEEFRLDREPREFSRIQWIPPESFRLSWLPEFKRGVYRQVFLDLFGLELR